MKNGEFGLAGCWFVSKLVYPSKITAPLIPQVTQVGCMCAFVSGTVSGRLIESDLGGFGFLLLCFYVFFPNVGDRDGAAERGHRRRGAMDSLLRLRSPRNSMWDTDDVSADHSSSSVEPLVH